MENLEQIDAFKAGEPDTGGNNENEGVTAADSAQISSEGISKQEARSGTQIFSVELGWYFKKIKNAFFFGISVVLAATITTLFLPEIWSEVVRLLTFLFKLLLWGWIGWWVVHKHAVPVKVAAVAAGLAGIGIGLGLGVFRFFYTREAWTFFNLTIEPVISGIYAWVIGGIFAMIRSFGKKRKRVIN